MIRQAKLKMSDQENPGTRFRKEALSLAPENNKGIVYADLFEVALGSLKEKGKIDSWQATERYSQLDQEGIDYLVEAEGRTIPIQITSTHDKARKKRKKQREAGKREIPIIRLVLLKEKRDGGLKSVERVEKDILETISSYQEQSF